MVPDPNTALGRTAGCSGTPLARKLGIKEGSSVVLVGAPDGFEEVLFPPEGAVVSRRLPPVGRRAVDVAVMRPAGGLWVAWPKRASGMATDLTENVMRDLGVAHGLVDNKVCAVTEIWSGLRFVLRLKDRPQD